ncbi:hypothetical protein [Streptomyces sp. NPDC023327]|uniref:hypothetical protein n=1 Tax=Streptomyces sp. NPDC023327 TaxID=3157088 RepID=UPI0033E9B553
MNTMTSVDNTSSGSTRTDTGRDHALRLRGVTWRVWRQHRATHWTLLIAGAVMTAAFIGVHLVVVSHQGLDVHPALVRR